MRFLAADPYKVTEPCVVNNTLILVFVAQLHSDAATANS